MPSHLLPNTFACAPIGQRLSQRIGPYRGYAETPTAERPLFSLEVATRIAEDYRSLSPQDSGGGGYDAHYHAAQKAFRFYDPEADVWYTWEGEAAGVATLYPIGEGAWRWECGV
jgi:hypothetical protein